MSNKRCFIQGYPFCPIYLMQLIKKLKQYMIQPYVISLISRPLK